MMNDNVFGERLRSLRMTNGNETQKDFAVRMGIPQPTLSLYETGKMKPTIDVVISIADKCGVSVDWLCGRDAEHHMSSLADVFSCFIELFETNEFSIKTTIHDRVDMPDDTSNKDSDRNWIDLKMYHNEVRVNPDATLNMELCWAISKAYLLNKELRQYERSQENYEMEKKRWIDYAKNTPITKIDHSDVSEEERRKKMFEIMKAEMEDKNKKS